MAKRPSVDGEGGSIVTTPNAAGMIQLLGLGVTSQSVAMSRSEFNAVRKMYGFKPEGPNKKPPPPKAPKEEDFKDKWEYDVAMRRHGDALKAHEKWTDPQPLMQAGADRNAIRRAEMDGLRLLAWLARYVKKDQDPMKLLIQMVADAGGYDVDPSDIEWAETEDEEDDSDDGGA